MANFKNSFDLGLKAAADTAEKISEINSVFEEMNAQIMEASGGKIAISRETRFDTTMETLLGLGMFSQKKLIEKSTTTTYIVAANPLSTKTKKADIGQIEINKNGYPCEIKFGNDRFVCDDKQALERILSVMLADADVGKEFTRLINQPTEDVPE
ncbi:MULTISPECIES: hypothetical protein [unclassified Pseudomonas]|uniref:hypothetical protein n=1 Tax=unclassified Pseudomonas TaxID=196821 RepID=UPI000876D94A|nr:MULTISPECIES: hypothetical protein [unclassified Pseudomonas]SCZ38081.1 hypothetical protein SAMN03159405_03905 [Pseudomonas sp. NFACC44-2]SDA88637.1 hypothetical protein SAMN03159429_05415 [Pseudomonas sp. NFACC51]SFI02670.1 hypothetical protein SAMN03159302_03205 [Pseudomonas sp. NFACC54]SFT24429.1 hypothetical protein SAMN03159306_04944 [Pseudomonas sp. NFACC48-1]